MNNSTIKPKQKICVECKKPNYIFSRSMCKTCASKTYAPIKKVSDKRMIEDFGGDESRSNLITDLDATISKYIRIKYSNSKGVVNCFTSGVEMKWQNSQCGHYISRSNMATRFLEENLRVQSPYDNCNLHGNLIVFKERLEAENKGITDYLEELSRQVYKPSISELKEILTGYREKLRIAEMKLKS